MDEVIWQQCSPDMCVLKINVDAAGVVCGVGTHMVSVFFYETVSPKTLKISSRIVIIIPKPRDDCDGTIHASSASSPSPRAAHILVCSTHSSLLTCC